MFEKEAEEYVKEQFPNDEFLQSEISRKLVSFAEYAYNKANEWHYVKDELPPEDDVYLIYTTRGVLLGHYEQGGADGETAFNGEPYSDFTEYPSEMLFTEDEVIAWKEIVLPKESE